jgi:hypothetical protein
MSFRGFMGRWWAHMRGRLSERRAQVRAYSLNMRACVRACQGYGRALRARLKGKQARS